MANCSQRGCTFIQIISYPNLPKTGCLITAKTNQLRTGANLYESTPPLATVCPCLKQHKNTQVRGITHYAFFGLSLVFPCFCVLLVVYYSTKKNFLHFTQTTQLTKLWKHSTMAKFFLNFFKGRHRTRCSFDYY